HIASTGDGPPSPGAIPIWRYRNVRSNSIDHRNFLFPHDHARPAAPEKVAEMLRNLKNGDKVITNGGIYGTIVGLEDDAVQLRIAEQVKIKISRNAIAGLQPEPKGS